MPLYARELCQVSTRVVVVSSLFMRGNRFKSLYVRELFQVSSHAGLFQVSSPHTRKLRHFTSLSVRVFFMSLQVCTSTSVHMNSRTFSPT